MICRGRNDSIEQARARSAAYAFLANALRYPDAEMMVSLMNFQCGSAGFGIFESSYPGLIEHLQAVTDELQRASGGLESLARALREVYLELFGHAVRGECPPYEMEYGKSEIIQQASELADIQGFYAAFGLAMVDRAHERTDHAAAECEFMSALASKLAYALEHHNCEAEKILADAQRSFLTDHLGRWLPAFARRLENADPDGFYGKIGAFIQKFIPAECEGMDASCGPVFLELRPIDPDRDMTIQCGIEECCPGGTSDFVQIRTEHGRSKPS